MIILKCKSCGSLTLTQNGNQFECSSCESTWDSSVNLEETFDLHISTNKDSKINLKSDKWISANGKAHDVSEMSTMHLKNALNFLIGSFEVEELSESTIYSKLLIELGLRQVKAMADSQ